MKTRGPARSGPLASHPALVDGVYDQLIEMLMDQRIAPDAPIRTEAIARQLGVSATPVREALARIEPSGLVARSARRGWTAAATLTRAELVQVIDLRLLLEPEIARLACARAGDDLRGVLARAVRRQAVAKTGPDYANYKEFLDADWDFHQLLASNSGNPYLERTFRAASFYMQRYLLFDERVVTDANESTAEHEAIQLAFERQSPDLAAAAMRDHLQRLRGRVDRPPAEAAESDSPANAGD